MDTTALSAIIATLMSQGFEPAVAAKIAAEATKKSATPAAPAATPAAPAATPAAPAATPAAPGSYAAKAATAPAATAAAPAAAPVAPVSTLENKVKVFIKERSGNNYYKTTLCRNGTECSFGSKCNRAHSGLEMKIGRALAYPGYRTVMCENGSECSFGENCRFAHSMDEMNLFREITKIAAGGPAVKNDFRDADRARNTLDEHVGASVSKPAESKPAEKAVAVGAAWTTVQNGAKPTKTAETSNIAGIPANTTSFEALSEMSDEEVRERVAKDLAAASTGVKA